MTTLQERLDRHATWLATAGTDGDRLVLTDERHPGIRLDGADLTEAWLHGCDFSGASLRGVQLVRAELHGTILDGADCHSARLVLAEGQDVSAVGTSLVNADLVRLWATRWNLTRADLSRSYLLRADFDHSDLTGARLVDADLDRTGFAGSVLDDLDAAGAEGTVAAEPSQGTDAAGLVALLRKAGASDVTLVDTERFRRDEWRRWRHPLTRGGTAAEET